MNEQQPPTSPSSGEIRGKLFFGSHNMTQKKSTYDGFHVFLVQHDVNSSSIFQRALLHQAISNPLEDPRRQTCFFCCFKEDFCSWIQVDIDGLFRLQV